VKILFMLCIGLKYITIFTYLAKENIDV
jgi:hypothetical protein